MTRRALVLGGGGITGIAWEVGVLTGLAEAGVDLSDADVIVGTSAGSVVGALVASGRPLAQLYAHQIAALAGDEVSARRVSPDLDALRRGITQSRLGGRDWPDRGLLITAVDADSGEPRVFDRTSGVPLGDAVRASCAVPLVWPPVEIEGHRYMDGGVRSITNADLARGCDRVVVVAPITVTLRRSGGIGRQLASLGPGVRSMVISPDRAAQKAIGRNVLSPATRPASARAGHAQAAAEASAVERTWDV